MIATDFEYAGEYLKDWGYVICNKDTPTGFAVNTGVSDLQFDHIENKYGKSFDLTTSYYSDRIEISFQICKSPCINQKRELSVYDIRAIRRWLNRPIYHKFKLIQNNWTDYYLMGSFNVSELQLNGQTYLLDLTFVANTPTALHEPINYQFTMDQNETYILFDESDEIGHIYPSEMSVTCLKGGDLIINNSIENRETIITNCSIGEIITFNSNLVISSSIPDHKIQEDFNFCFFRIANNYENRKNELSFSLPVIVKITYSPFVKVVL